MAFSDLCHPGHKDGILRNMKHVQTFADSVVDFLTKLMGILESSSRDMKQLAKVHRKKAEELMQQLPANHQFGFMFLPEWENMLEEVEQATVEIHQLFSTKATTMLHSVPAMLAGSRSTCKQVFAFRETLDKAVKRQEDEVNTMRGKLVSAFHNHASKRGDKALERVYQNQHNEYIIRMKGYNCLAQGALFNDLPAVMGDIEDVVTSALSRVSIGIQETLGLVTDSWELTCNTLGKFNEKIRAKSIKDTLAAFADTEKDLFGEYEFTNVEFVLPQAKKPGMPVYTDSLIRNDNTTAALARLHGEFLREHSGLVDDIRERQQELDEIVQTRSELIEQTSSLTSSVMTELEERLCKTRCGMRQCQLRSTHLKAYLDQFELEEDTYAATCGGSEGGDGGNQLGSHHFAEQTYMTPTTCAYCKKMLLGIRKQGLHCKQCKMNVHRQCRTKVPYCKRALASRELYILSPESVAKMYKDALTDCHNSQNQSELLSTGVDPSRTKLQKRPLPGTPQQSTLPEGQPLSPNKLYGQPHFSSQADAAPPLPDKQLSIFAQPVPDKPVGMKPRIPRVSSMPCIPDGEQPPPLPTRPQRINSPLPTKREAKLPPLPSKPASYKQPPGSPGYSTVNKKKFLIALYDYKAQTERDLTICTGDRIEFIEDIDQFTKGRVNGQTGIFPKMFVHPLKPNERIFRAMYNFNGEANDELSAQQGDIIVVDQPPLDGGWLIGRCPTTEKEGVFPEVYVTEV